MPKPTTYLDLWGAWFSGDALLREVLALAVRATPEQLAKMKQAATETITRTRSGRQTETAS